MWTAKPPYEKKNSKSVLDIVQSLVTIGAVIFGGVWSYILFIQGRNWSPHANIEHKLSHIELSKELILMRVEIDVSNTGTSQLRLAKTVIRIQQILPISRCPAQGPCAKQEIKIASEKIERESDGFTWPLVAKRETISEDVGPIEPGEKQSLEYEFILPSDVKIVRVYTYFKNGIISEPKNEIGWEASSYYDLRPSNEGGKK
jgi:hypothetical protein